MDFRGATSTTSSSSSFLSWKSLLPLAVVVLLVVAANVTLRFLVTDATFEETFTVDGTIGFLSKDNSVLGALGTTFSSCCK